MKLYLVQHGESLSKEMDPNRPLTTKGRDDVEKVALFLKKLKLEIPSIRHSPKTRAQQTAELINKVFSLQESLMASEDLTPNAPVAPLLKELQERVENLVIVGHLPFLAKLASSLLVGTEQEFLTFRQGGWVCLAREENRPWQIEWMLPPI